MSNFGPPTGPPPGAPRDPSQPPPPPGSPTGPPWAQPGYAPTGPRLANWVQRLLSGLVDTVLLVPFYLVSSIGGGLARESGFFITSIGVIAIFAGWIGLVSFAFWNHVVRQGRTGRTIGKGVLGLALARKGTDGAPGLPQTFLRQAFNALGWVLIFLSFYTGFTLLFFGTVLCLVNYLWPLWDRNRQTVGDKISGTVVVSG